MNSMNKNLVVINAWYIDKNGITQKLSFDTYGDYKYKDYLGYQYFGVSSCVTNKNTPPYWRYQIHPIDIGAALEHGERSHRTIIFSNITGLKPKYFTKEPQHILNDFEALRSTGFFDHVSIWVDEIGCIYYLLEPYSSSKNWYQIFNSKGFDSIEVHRPIAPYQGGGPGSSSRSFLISRIANQNQPYKIGGLQKIHMRLKDFFEFLNSDPDLLIEKIREEGDSDE